MTKPLETIPLDARLLRLCEVLEIIPISKSSWWAGVKAGKYPKPIKLGPRTTCWRLSDVLELVEAGISSPDQSQD